MKQFFRLKGLLGLSRATRNTFNSLELQKQPEEVKKFSSHRQLVPLYDLHPSVGPACYIAPNATIIGDVTMGSDCVIWYNAVLRGDLNEIHLHSWVVVGERVVIHTAAALPTGIPAKVDIGMHVVIQSNSTLYSCTIGNEVLVGHRSVIMEGSKLEDGCAIGPNSVVPPGRIIPSNQLWAGNPVQYIRDLEQNEVFQFNTMAKLNSELGNSHKYEFLTYNSAYLSKDYDADETDPKEFSGHTATIDDEIRKNHIY